MAYAVRIDGYGKDSPTPVFTMEPPWWPAQQLMSGPRFSKSRDSSGYLDFEAHLSLSEARSLHEQLRPLATQGVYSYTGWQTQIQPMLQALDLVFGPRAPEFNRFRVWIFEWESGLG